MLVKELIECLKKLDGNMKVYFKSDENWINIESVKKNINNYFIKKIIILLEKNI